MVNSQEWQATEKQAALWKAITKEGYRYVLYGGAIRGGKTYGGCATIIALSMLFPGSRWAIVRRDLPTIRVNVAPTWDRVVSEMGLSDVAPDINRQSWSVKFPNGSEVLFWTEQRERDPDLNRWRGLEVSGFLLDEVNELAQATFDKAIERAGSWKPRGDKMPPVLILMTANPSRTWVKEQIYDVWKAGKLERPWLYIPATPHDNPHLSPQYLENIEALKDRSPLAYRRFVLGDWDATDGDLFKSDMFAYHDGVNLADMREVVVIGDLAYTAKKHSDETAIGVAAIDHAGTRYWITTDHGRWETAESTDKILDLVVEYSRQFPKLKTYVEAHKSYLESLRQRARERGVQIDLRELHHGGEKKVDRIAAAQSGMTNWRFDHGSKWLVDQFLDWSPELEGKILDDGCDMHAYADTVLRWKKSASRYDGAPPRPDDPLAARIWDARFGKKRKSRV